MKKVDIIIKALKNLGGQANYKSIYKEYENICNDNGIDLGDSEYNGVPVWHSVVRRTIQQHSSHSGAYIKSNEDLFVPTHGVGKGTWALKSTLKGSKNTYLTSARKQQQELLDFFVEYLGFDEKSSEHLPFQYMNESNVLIKGDIDVIAYYRGYTFICECKQGGSIKKDFSKWVTNNVKNLSYLTSDKVLKKHKKHEIKNIDLDKIIYIYDTKYDKGNASFEWCKKQISSESQISKNPMYKNHILLNNDIIKYYKKESELTDKSIAANWFLNYCGINSPEEELEVDATKVNFNDDTTGYVFVVNPNDFIPFAYVARRLPHQSSNNFYQRLLKSTRLTDIAENYLDKDYGYFPNNIVANIQEKDSFDFIQDSKNSSKGKLVFKKTCAARIIDGQHRLFSYLKSKNSDGQVIINALDTTTENESRLFIEINAKQQNVPPNLIWDLVGVLDPRTLKGVISNSLRHIQDDKNSIFFNKIKFSTSSEKNKINLAGLCRALDEEKSFFKNEYMTNNKKNSFYFNQTEFDENLYKKTGNIISSFFLKLKTSLGSFGDDYFSFGREYIFYINIKMCLLTIKHFSIRGQTFDERIVGNFFEDYAEIIKNTEFLSPEGKSLSGYGNYGILLKKYILKIRSKYKNFAPDVKIDMDKKIDMPSIEKEIHQISIMLFEKIHGKNYIDQFFPSRVVERAREKSGNKQHPQYLIPAKMALDALMTKRFSPKAMEGKVQITKVGASRFEFNEIVSKEKFANEIDRLNQKDKKLEKPKSSNKITYFDYYLSKYLFTEFRLGGLIPQRYELENYFKSLIDYRSSFEDTHAQGWSENMDFDELFNQDVIDIYKKQSKLLLNSLVNCRKKLKKDLSKT